MSRNKNNKKRIRAILEEGPKTTGQIMTRLKDDESTRGTRKITVNGEIIGYKKVKRSNRRLDAPTMNQLCNIMRFVANKEGFCKETKQVIWELKEETI